MREESISESESTESGLQVRGRRDGTEGMGSRGQTEIAGQRAGAGPWSGRQASASRERVGETQQTVRRYRDCAPVMARAESA